MICLRSHSKAWYRKNLNSGTVIPEPMHLTIISVIYCYVTDYPKNVWSWNNNEYLLSHTVSMHNKFWSCCLPWVLRIFHSGSASLTRLRSVCQLGLPSAESCLEAEGSSLQWLVHMADKPAGGLSSLPHVPLPKAAWASSWHGNWISTEFRFKERARWKWQFLYFSGLAQKSHSIISTTFFW